MTFDDTNIYKLVETPSSQIARLIRVAGDDPKIVRRSAPGSAKAEIEHRCFKCQKTTKIHANLGKPGPIKPGFMPFPMENKFICPGCGAEQSLIGLRREIEGQANLPVVQ